MVVGFFFVVLKIPKKKHIVKRKNIFTIILCRIDTVRTKKKRNDKKLDLNLSCLFIYLCYFSFVIVCACGVSTWNVYFAYRLFDEPNSIWENIWRAINKNCFWSKLKQKKKTPPCDMGLHFALLLFLCACVCVRLDCKWVKMIDDDKIIKKTTELWVVHKITLIFFTVTLGISQWITHTLTVGRSVGSRKTSIFGVRVCCVNGQSLIKMRRVFNRFHLTHTHTQGTTCTTRDDGILLPKIATSRLALLFLSFFDLLLRRIHSGIFTLHLRRLLSN